MCADSNTCKTENVHISTNLHDTRIESMTSCIRLTIVLRGGKNGVFEFLKFRCHQKKVYFRTHAKICLNYYNISLVMLERLVQYARASGQTKMKNLARFPVRPARIAFCRIDNNHVSACNKFKAVTLINVRRRAYPVEPAARCQVGHQLSEGKTGYK